MWVSGELHAPGTDPATRTDYKARRATNPNWTLWRKYCLPLPRVEPQLLGRQPRSIVTNILWVQCIYGYKSKPGTSIDSAAFSHWWDKTTSQSLLTLPKPLRLMLQVINHKKAILTWWKQQVSSCHYNASLRKSSVHRTHNVINFLCKVCWTHYFSD
jgi:hypothetical protein